MGASVTALDLEAPAINHERVTCVKGDVTELQFADAAFDVVFCAEVLEHVRPETLAAACAELARVARNYVIIGVPYRQDTRVGRTTCVACGRKNPPWGHLNVFNEGRIARLFPRMTMEKIQFVGSSDESTNVISSWLMDLAGNPYGTYRPGGAVRPLRGEAEGAAAPHAAPEGNQQGVGFGGSHAAVGNARSPELDARPAVGPQPARRRRARLTVSQRVTVTGEYRDQRVRIRRAARKRSTRGARWASVHTAAVLIVGRWRQALAKARRPAS